MTTCACGNCQFFDTQSKPIHQKDRDIGLCRYNPPMAQAGGTTPAVWPLVESRDWCGHFAVTVERFMTAAE
ncbi:MAG TPA: hypothetical protein VNR51_04380 [Hyphomicrobium sp.]|nr:hypothetical protein [Hyphomicrobium sp.]